MHGPDNAALSLQKGADKRKGGEGEDAAKRAFQDRAGAAGITKMITSHHLENQLKGHMYRRRVRGRVDARRGK